MARSSRFSWDDLRGFSEWSGVLHSRLFSRDGFKVPSVARRVCARREQTENEGMNMLNNRVLQISGEYIEQGDYAVMVRISDSKTTVLFE